MLDIKNVYKFIYRDTLKLESEKSTKMFLNKISICDNSRTFNRRLVSLSESNDFEILIKKNDFINDIYILNKNIIAKINCDIKALENFIEGKAPVFYPTSIIVDKDTLYVSDINNVKNVLNSNIVSIYCSNITIKNIKIESRCMKIYNNALYYRNLLKTNMENEEVRDLIIRDLL